jgi:hypothetical protein
MTAVALATKRCTACGLVKPLDRFSPHAGTRDGCQPRCKACRADYIRERRATDPVLAQRERAQNEAYKAAMSLLRERHRVEFDAIYADELTARGLS